MDRWINKSMVYKGCTYMGNINRVNIIPYYTIPYGG